MKHNYNLDKWDKLSTALTLKLLFNNQQVCVEAYVVEKHTWVTMVTEDVKDFTKEKLNCSGCNFFCYLQLNKIISNLRCKQRWTGPRSPRTLGHAAVSKTITISPNQKPWLNTEVHRLLRIRDAAFKAGDAEALRVARRSLTVGVKRAKSNYKKNTGSFLI